MDLINEDQIALAALLDHPGYRVLLRLLKGREEQLLDAMRGTADAHLLMSKARFWQAFSQFRQMFEGGPISAANELIASREALADPMDEEASDYTDPIWRFRNTPSVKIKTDS